MRPAFHHSRADRRASAVRTVLPTDGRYSSLVPDHGGVSERSRSVEAGTAPLLLALCVLAAALAPLCTTSWNDWHFYTEGADALFGSSGLHLYADHPLVAVGPLALVVTRGLMLVANDQARQVAAALATAAVLPAFVVIQQLSRSRHLWLLYWSPLVLVAWMDSSLNGQPGDAWAMLAVVAAVAALARGQAGVCGVLVGVSVLLKPWTVPLLLLPLAFGPGRERLRGVTAGVLTASVGYIPFLVADWHTLAAGHTPIMLEARSSLMLMGGDAALPYVRALQWGLGAAVVARLSLRGNAFAAIAAMAAVRLLFEPAPMPYYVLALAVGALLSDVADRRGVFTLWASLATLLLTPFAGPAVYLRSGILVAVLVDLLAEESISGRLARVAGVSRRYPHPAAPAAAMPAGTAARPDARGRPPR